MKIVRFSAGDIIVMRKPHPCGENKFKVLRAGSDVRIVCVACGRDVTVNRLKLEKNITQVITQSPDTVSDTDK